ncbi:MAG: hypothetical protein A2580_18155 [Hydrogenophilales bacterium RIFOXYD1_FULL_62_11]|nr:MAG: hypothetical protein A2580_18155 [Hydrogenophilales bacterium RIFOXYD1_FULL_62_11]
MYTHATDWLDDDYGPPPPAPPAAPATLSRPNREQAEAMALEGMLEVTRDVFKAAVYSQHVTPSITKAEDTWHGCGYTDFMAHFPAKVLGRVIDADGRGRPARYALTTEEDVLQ